jgi:hypothetical protein
MPQSRNPRVRRRVLLAPCVRLTEEGSPTASISRSPMNSDKDDDNDNDAAADPSDASVDESQDETNDNNAALEDGEFGDDFDDFEEGGDGDDFGDFDDGFQQGEEHAETTFEKPPDLPPVPAPSPGPVSQQYSILGLLSSEAPALR